MSITFTFTTLLHNLFTLQFIHFNITLQPSTTRLYYIWFYIIFYCYMLFLAEWLGCHRSQHPEQFGVRCLVQGLLGSAQVVNWHLTSHQSTLVLDLNPYTRVKILAKGFKTWMTDCETVKVRMPSPLQHRLQSKPKI